MKAEISKSQISGTIAAPASKSYTIRALFAAALAEGESRIYHPLSSEDTEAAAEVLGKLGAQIERQPAYWKVTGGNLMPTADELDCRQSAATLRFLAPVCAALNGPSRITFAPGLARRPMQPLLDSLEQLGVGAELTDGYLDIHGGGVETAEIVLPGDISSQYISGLLLAAPLLPEGLSVSLNTAAESRQYLRMTVGCLRRFGVKIEYDSNMTSFRVENQPYHPASYLIEGDWSSASYFLGLGALSGSISVTGLNKDSFQADKFMLNCLRRMGVRVSVSGEELIIDKSEPKGLVVDLNEAIDLLPTVACLAAAAEGRSILTGLERARLKESDRVSAVADNLKRMGVDVEEETDSLVITGTQPHGAVIDSFEDHRIAMAFAMLATKCGDTIIESAECVNKTYPGFWDDFRLAGGDVRLLDE